MSGRERVGIQIERVKENLGERLNIEGIEEEREQ